MRILCASNLHLGRRIPGIPDHLQLDPARLSTSAIWDQLVEIAVSEEVDAVLLAGNVIDRENRQFEPLGPLERGITTLERNGIPVVAVAGNQDFDALGPVARNVGEDALDVLASEQWDRVAIQDVGTVTGRSASGTSSSGQLSGDFPPPADVLMVHATLVDGATRGDVFEPVRSVTIEESEQPLWILGHRREPNLVTLGDAVVIEPGAICPLDPAETGSRGAWIVDSTNPAAAQLFAVSPVQFEDVNIDVSGTDSLEAIENAIVAGLHETLDRVVREDARGQLVCVPCAVHLTGTTDHHHELADLTRELSSTLDIQHQGVVGAITSVTIDTRPDIELEPLLGRPDPVGELARLLTALDDDGERTPGQDALIQRAVNRLQAVHRARVFATVAHDPEPDTESAQALLRRESWNVLDALVRQRGVE